jgi:hypothetical protein
MLEIRHLPSPPLALHLKASRASGAGHSLPPFGRQRHCGRVSPYCPREVSVRGSFLLVHQKRVVAGRLESNLCQSKFQGHLRRSSCIAAPLFSAGRMLLISNALMILARDREENRSHFASGKDSAAPYATGFQAKISTKRFVV